MKSFETKCPISGKICECPLIKVQRADILADDLNALREGIQRAENEIFDNITGHAASFFKKIYLRLIKQNLNNKHKRKAKAAREHCDIQ